MSAAADAALALESHAADELADRNARRRARWSAIRALVGRFGVVLAFVITLALFTALRGGEFFGWANLRIILITAAPIGIVCTGLTTILVMNDFDLSFGAVAGLASAIAIILAVVHHMSWPLAALLAIAAGAGSGLFVGGLVSYAGTSSFITTLAVSTGVTGLELLVGKNQAVYSGLPHGLVQVGQGTILGIDTPIIIAVVALALGYVLLEQTQTGRRMYAMGGNVVAARLAGVRVRRLRLGGFVLTGVAAAVGGIVLSAQQASYTPNVGTGLLLPAYAAVFLGSTVFRRGVFNIVGTLVGVLFLGVIQNGLVLTGLSTAWVNVTQGGILLLGILLSRVGAQRE